MPTMREFRESSKVSPVTMAAHFGGWKASLESAGFAPAALRFKYTEEEVKEELQQVAEKLGHSPSWDEFVANASISGSVVRQRLGGSWAAALRIAGLPPPPRHQSTPPGGWNKGSHKAKISKEELAYLYQTEGLSASAIGRKFGVGPNTMLRMLRENGIEVKRLQYSMPRETTIESRIYEELERRGVTYVKQQVVDGRYVVDALIPGPKIVIECDGDYWHARPGMAERDRKKDTFLAAHGYSILRFPEAAILADVGACVDKVVKALVDFYGEDHRRTRSIRPK